MINNMHTGGGSYESRSNEDETGGVNGTVDYRNSPGRWG